MTGVPAAAWGTSSAAAAELAARRRRSLLFRSLCTGLAWAGVAVLAVLLFHILRQGAGWVDWQFLTSFPSRFPEKAGVLAALAGTLWVIGLTTVIAVPLGVAAAIYLEEYAPPGRVSTLIEVNISNLAGVPSIVYGILGLTLFVRGLHLGRTVIAAALIMALLILPIIILAAREALRAVPNSLRQAAMALGVTRWRMIRDQVLPAAAPGILTGVILAVSRAMGETAPLIMTGALNFVAFVPKGPRDDFSALPVQIYNWASRPQPAFQDLAAAAIIVLLAVLLCLNATAVAIRHRSERNRSW